MLLCSASKLFGRLFGIGEEKVTGEVAGIASIEVGLKNVSDAFHTKLIKSRME